MLYRLYQPGDFEALYAVEELCFEPPFRFSRAYMRQLVENADGATWIADDNGKIAGFAIIEWMDAYEGVAAYISTLEVHPRWRRQGIGADLLRRIEDSARAAGTKTIWLHVDVENSAGIALYENHGYAKRGREEHFYARNHAAFIYAKRLEKMQQPTPEI